MAVREMASRLEQLCIDRGLKMTDQRRIIARVLSESDDHPDVELVYRRATEVDPKISIATVYRTVRLFEDASILTRHDFGDGRSRYEEMRPEHHDHLIDVHNGTVVEFQNETIEQLQKIVAEELGYRLIGHRLELYAVPLEQAGTGTIQARNAGSSSHGVGTGINLVGSAGDLAGPTRDLE